MQSQRNLLEGLSPLEIEFFSESERESSAEEPLEQRRVHVSRFAKWVVVIVAAAAVLVGLAAARESQSPRTVITSRRSCPAWRCSQT